MSVQLRGQVVDATRKGLAGFMIRVRDTEGILDNLASVAVTARDGAFHIELSDLQMRQVSQLQRDVRTLDIYFDVYAAPMRLIHTTPEPFTFEMLQRGVTISVPTQQTTPQNMTDRGQINGGLKLSERDLMWRTTGDWAVPQLADFSAAGLPGEATVLETTQTVLLPMNATSIRLTVDAGRAVQVTIANPFPVQPVRFDVPDDSPMRPNAALPRFLPLKRSRSPQTVVEMVRILHDERHAGVRVVTLAIRPLQYNTANGVYSFFPNLSYTLTYDLTDTSIPTGRNSQVNFDQLSTKVSMLTGITDLTNGVIVTDPEKWWTPGQLDLAPVEIPHVIITSNWGWSKSAIKVNRDKTRPPTPAEKDGALLAITSDGRTIVQCFQQLAEWRTRLGKRSRVVLIEDIVNPSGPYGDLTNGGNALDLQEVIRNFVRFAYKQWNTRYVLLGGDKNIVPVRYLPTIVGGWLGWDATRDKSGATTNQIEKNPPEKRGCFVFSGGKMAKVFFDPDMGLTPDPSMPIYIHRTGERIKFDLKASATSAGWYYTSKADFENTTKTTNFTRLQTPETTTKDGVTTTWRYIIVEGPNVNEDFYFMTHDRLFPSDFYYSSIEGDFYGKPGKRDFDANNNGLYGQYTYDYDAKTSKPLSNEGWDVYPDVYIGRAPITSGEDARAFVDKVMAYESLTIVSKPVNPAYVQRIVLTADRWEEFNWLTLLASAKKLEDAPEHYTFVPATGNYHIHSKDGSVSRQLVVNFGGDMRRVLKHKTKFKAGEAGWQFVDKTFSTPSSQPTEFVQVIGLDKNVPVISLFWDEKAAETATAQQEALRQQMADNFPQFTHVMRHYAEDYDVASNSSTVVRLSSPSLLAALNSGTHFLSLTGHGSPDGCSSLDITGASSLTNAGEYFIAFADSCSTARTDWSVPSLGEALVTMPDAGAVAYLGYTRTSYWPTSNANKEAFWKLLAQTGDLGIAGGTRLVNGSVPSMAHHVGLMLYGDPGMRVWNTTLNFYNVVHASSAKRGSTFRVTVCTSDGSGLQGQTVTLLNGYPLSLTSSDIRYYEKRKSSMYGSASFLIPNDPAITTVTLTVSGPNFKPYSAEIKVE